jgi:hypothetical protein
MRRCKNCETEYNDDVLFCEKCKKAMPIISKCSVCLGEIEGTEDMCKSCEMELNIRQEGNEENESTYSIETKDSNTYSNTTTDFISMSQNEIHVKTYHCTTLQRPSGEGYLTVTNKRVVFHGYGSSAGGKSKLVSEVPIEHVSGISSYYGYGTRVNFIIFSIISLIVSIVFFYLKFSSKSYDSPNDIYIIIAIIFLSIAGVLYFFSKKTNYNLCIFSSGANGSPINIGDGGYGSKITGQGAIFAIVAEPTEETEKMMNEIGAVILDLKTMGDHAIEKWSDSKKNKKTKNKNQGNTLNKESSKTDEEYFK